MHSGEHDSFTESRYRQFLRHLPGSALHVLDAGSSTGSGGRTLISVRPDLHLIALDCVPRHIAELPPGVYARGIVGSSTEIDLPDESVDAVLAGEFIEHLADEDVGLTLREFRRVLRPGGSLLLTTPNPGYVRLRIAGIPAVRGLHLSAHSPREMQRRLRGLGLEPKCLRGSGRVSRIVGERFPLLSLYGSYLLVARRS